MNLVHSHEVKRGALETKLRLKAPLTKYMKEQAVKMAGDPVHACLGVRISVVSSASAYLGGDMDRLFWRRLHQCQMLLD